MVTSELPYRGPKEYVEGSMRYTFKYEGDLEDCVWKEEITENGKLLFSQTGFSGIIIGKDKNKQSIYPWDF